MLSSLSLRKDDPSCIKTYLKQLLNPDSKEIDLVRLPLYSGIRSGIIRKTFSISATANSSGNLFFCAIPSLIPNIGVSSSAGPIFIDNTTGYLPFSAATPAVAGGVNCSGFMNLPTTSYSQCRLLGCKIQTLYSGVALLSQTGNFYCCSDTVSPGWGVSASTPLTIWGSTAVANNAQAEYSIPDVIKLEHLKGPVNQFTPTYTWRPRSFSEMTQWVVPSGNYASTSTIYTPASGMNGIGDVWTHRDVCVMIFEGCQATQKITFNFDMIIEVECDSNETNLDIGYTHCYTEPLTYLGKLNHDPTNFLRTKSINSMVDEVKSGDRLNAIMMGGDVVVLDNNKDSRLFKTVESYKRPYVKMRGS